MTAQTVSPLQAELQAVYPGNHIFQGFVAAKEEDALIVTGEAGTVRCTRAAGCLLEPEPGDLVLVSLMHSGGSWVLSVLQKKTGKGTLKLPEDTDVALSSLGIRANSCSVTARELLTNTDKQISKTGVFWLQASVATVCGSMLMKQFANARSILGRLHERIARHTEDCDSFTQRAEETIEVSSRRVLVDTDAGLRVRSENVDVKARKLLDMDAKQIKLG